MPSNSLPLIKMWAMPTSSLHWAWDRSGQLTTQWLSIPQLKQFFLPKLLAIIFLAASFLPGTGWGFLPIEPSLANAAAFSAAACLSGLAFLRKGDAAPSFNAAGLAFLEGGFILVRKLEDFVVGAGDHVGSHEGVVVDFFLRSL
jgi:hypothetical protein